MVPVTVGKSHDKREGTMNRYVLRLRGWLTGLWRVLPLLYGWVEMVVKWVLRGIRWIVWELVGLRAVWERIRPPAPDDKRPKPATFGLWTIGIYAALFGIVSQRYEDRLNLIMNRANILIAQGASVKLSHLLPILIDTQNAKVPYRPDIFSPTSLMYTLQPSKDATHRDIVVSLREIIVGQKDSLQRVNLRGANLDKANLDKANLRLANLRGATLRGATLHWTALAGADLTIADFNRADLGGAELAEADLSGARFGGANLTKAFFKDADCTGAILTGANLFRADLRGARNLTLDQLLETKTLYEADLDSVLLQQVKEKRPDLLEKPPDDYSF